VAVEVGSHDRVFPLMTVYESHQNSYKIIIYYWNSASMSPNFRYQRIH